MRISVIIVSYNSGTLLLECVQAVLCSSVAVEVIVSDNGSIDCSIDALEDLARRDDRLAILKNNKNLGFAKGNNAALARARGDYVLFINPDCIVGASALGQMVAALEANPKAGMAGCLIRNPDGTEQIGCRRLIPTPRRTLARILPFGQRLNRDELGNLSETGQLPEQPVSVEAISGAFMLIRRDVLAKIGSFDEAYFMHWEDLDLCLCFRNAGWDILFVPGVEIVHFKGRSSNQRPYFVEWHKHVGLIRFFRKFYYQNYPLPIFALIALAIFMRFFLRVLQMRLQPVEQADFSSPRQFYCRGLPEVWVFGASSLVGRFLLPRLVAAGYCVRAFSRDPAAVGGIDSMQLIWHEFDFGAGAALPTVGRPEIVIHLAPLRLAPSQIETLAVRGMKRLIGFSSTSLFTKRVSKHPKERGLVADLTAAEGEIERQCGRLGVEWSVFRPTMIYSLGYDRNVSVLAGFIRSAGFFPMPGAGSGLRQPVHADDLAQACVAILAAPSAWNRAYNLSGSQVLSYRRLVEAIFSKLGLRPRILSLPRPWWRLALLSAKLLPAYRDINMEMIDRVNADMCFDHAEASRSFGFAPRGVEL